MVREYAYAGYTILVDNKAGTFSYGDGGTDLKNISARGCFIINSVIPARNDRVLKPSLSRDILTYMICGQWAAY